MPEYRDQIGRKFELKAPPRRIVSLVPSLTELLCDLGLEGNLVGVTKFCVHPKNLRKAKTDVGGTKKLHLDRIEDLNPDLIIANKEENNRHEVEELASKYPVYVSDIESFDDVHSFILDIGALSGNVSQAQKLNAKIIKAVNTVKNGAVDQPPLRAVYLIWKDPFMAAGTDTFISKMLNLCGVKNALTDWGEKGLRYPEITIEEIKSMDPEILLLSSEPYPFKDKHLKEIGAETRLPVKLVDGEAFSWYGSRILHSLPYLLKFVQDLPTFYR